MDNTNKSKKYFYKPQHHKGSKAFTSKKKSAFYKYMYQTYKKMSSMADDLVQIEKWLLDYDGSEYALIEIRNLIKALRSKSDEAIIRYDNRVKSFSK